jgi:methyltransferase (TIGR00027 family)
MLFFGEQPGYRELIPPGLVEANRRLLAGAGLLKDWHTRVYQTRSFRGLTRAADVLVGGGVMVHFPLRKRFVEDQVREAVAGGAEQLLIIGAGLDTLAPRLAGELPELLAVEIDHPSTGVAKARGVVAAGMSRENLVLVPIDLAARPLSEALGRTPWRPVASVVVAEGLLMYLPVDAVQALFTALHAQTGPGSRVVFTWLPESDDGDMKLDRLTRASIAAVGEPVRFSIAADALGPFLAALGWRLLPPVDLRARYLSGGPLAEVAMTDVERFSVAERV